MAEFEEQHRVRRDDDGAVIPRKKRRASRFNWDLARLNITVNYYGPNPVFDDGQFERIFRIKKVMADELLAVLAHADPWFGETYHNKSGSVQIDPKAKLLITLKSLAYGCSPTAFQDIFQMGRRTAYQTVKRFCRIVRTSPDLNERFLCKMTRSDARKISDLHLFHHGVEGMMGSIDCMHTYWKNCPMAHRGHYAGKEGHPTIVLEAVANHNLFFWHTAFGFPGTHNDINILEQSPLHKDMLDGTFHRDVDFDYTVNNQSFGLLFYLADRIYPECSRFVKTLSKPHGTDKIQFASWQEGACKDIERAFGVIQRKFSLLHRPFEQWYVEDIKDIVYTCLLLHNWMVTERVKRMEPEHADLYDAVDTNHPLNQPDTDAIDQELEDMYREDAEYEELQRFVDVEGVTMPYIMKLAITRQLAARKSKYFSQMSKIADHRWHFLYNVKNHHRLRDAVIEEVANKTNK